MSKLAVSFENELVRLLAPEERLGFGRQAGLALDPDNQFMHRTVGEFSNEADIWWLHNRGRRIAITVVHGNSESTIGSFAKTPLFAGHSFTRFQAGPDSYELEIEVLEDEGTTDTADVVEIEGGTTLNLPTIPLNDEQRALLTALAEPRLARSGDPLRIATTNELASHLLLTNRQIERKLDWICLRLDPSSVYGMKGAPGIEARDRRVRLIRYVLASQMITTDDLDFLRRYREERLRGRE